MHMHMCMCMCMCACACACSCAYSVQEGYREYAAALAAALPSEMQPRIAPVGTAF